MQSLTGGYRDEKGIWISSRSNYATANVGSSGKDDKNAFDLLIDKVEELKKTIGIPASIRDFGVKEEDFLATLDEMTENAFNDQCTGANPRYPLMSEIKQLYLLAYYGKPTKEAEKI